MISATVVPIHPPKYRWAIKFLDAYKKYATKYLGDDQLDTVDEASVLA